MSSYSDLASISSAIENLELRDTFHDQDEEIRVEDPSIGAEAVCVQVLMLMVIATFHPMATITLGTIIVFLIPKVEQKLLASLNIAWRQEK
jgi:hypothetical protein